MRGKDGCGSPVVMERRGCSFVARWARRRVRRGWWCWWVRGPGRVVWDIGGFGVWGGGGWVGWGVFYCFFFQFLFFFLGFLLGDRGELVRGIIMFYF